jgi:hypothetical protein
MENSELNSNLGTPNQMVGDFFVHTDFAPQRWICPKCGHVMSPNTPFCPFCPPKHEFGTSATSTSSTISTESYASASLKDSDTYHYNFEDIEKEDINVDGRKISLVTVPLNIGKNEGEIHIY